MGCSLKLLMLGLLSLALFSVALPHSNVRKIFNLKYRHLKRQLKIAASKFRVLDFDDPRVTAMDKTMDKMLELIHDARAGDHQCQQTDEIVDIGSDSSVLVKVPRTFQNCLNNMHKGRLPERNANIWCLRDTLWKWEYDEGSPVGRSSHFRSKRSVHWDNLIQNLTINGYQHPPSGFRTRKEYRALSPVERTRFHNALQGLYDDGTMETFTVIHLEALISNGAHGGPAFLPWHRAFISLFEEELRRIDSRVSLPYWDSSIDRRMGNLAWRSVMWDDQHLGQGVGEVNTGPFAGWVTLNGPLRRDIDNDSDLIRRRHIKQFMRNCRLQGGTSGWEGAHNNVHTWIGGTMIGLYAAADPVFYLHHCFIDYQWEKFRQRQRTSACPGVDPLTDYPPVDEDNKGQAGHGPDQDMTGLEFLKNQDGIAAFWTDNWFGYENTPSCGDKCANSPDLFCKNGKLCVGVQMNGDRKRQKRRSREHEYANYMTLNVTQNPGNRTASGNGKSPRYGEKFAACRYNLGRICISNPLPNSLEDVTDAVWLYDLPSLRDIEEIREAATVARVRSRRTAPDASKKFFPEFPEPEEDIEADDDDEDEGEYSTNRETSVYRYLEYRIKTRGYRSPTVKLAPKYRGPN